MICRIMSQEGSAPPNGARLSCNDSHWVHFPAYTSSESCDTPKLTRPGHGGDHRLNAHLQGIVNLVINFPQNYAKWKSYW